MVDPTSDLCEDIDPEDAPICATCEARLIGVRDHRVVTWLEGGQVETRHFCDDDCKAEWLEDHGPQR